MPFWCQGMGQHQCDAHALASELVKVFKRLYLLNLWMEVIHICPDVTYWLGVLCFTILTNPSDLEVKVMDLETIYVKSFWLKFLTLVLLNLDIHCLCKQCRSRSVGFWRSQLIWIYTVWHLVCEFVLTSWIRQSDWLKVTSGHGILIYSVWQGLKGWISWASGRR